MAEEPVQNTEDTGAAAAAAASPAPPPPPPTPANKEVIFSSVKACIFIDTPKASDAIDFYRDAFGAEVVSRVVYPKRKADQDRPILFAELKLGGLSFVVSDRPAEYGESPVDKASKGLMFQMETQDFSAAAQKARSFGAVIHDVVNLPFGTASGKVIDPYGIEWLITSTEHAELDDDADQEE